MDVEVATLENVVVVEATSVVEVVVVEILVVEEDAVSQYKRVVKRLYGVLGGGGMAETKEVGLAANERALQGLAISVTPHERLTPETVKISLVSSMAIFSTVEALVSSGSRGSRWKRDRSHGKFFPDAHHNPDRTSVRRCY